MSQASSLRIFHLVANEATELPAIPSELPAQGFVWIACSRSYFSEQLGSIQTAMQALAGTPLLDLHVSDLLNAQLPSHYDYTSQYDVLVIRRLATSPDKASAAALSSVRRASGNAADNLEAATPHIDTTPVGFAAWDRVLLSVHPEDCTVRDGYARRLMQFSQLTPVAQAASADALSNVLELGNISASTRERLAREDRTYHIARKGSQPVPVRLPTSPADLMMRIVNIIVDNYLDLRRELSRHLDQWQSALLSPRRRIANWQALLDARRTLHRLDEICEDQRAAVQDWVDSVETWPMPDSASAQRELDQLKVRSRDVLEHIERVVHHVRRLEQSTEAAVQMHFNMQSNRANDIMRTLTTITAIFLPLNLIAAIFGMNFEFIPFVHKKEGFWWAMGVMGFIAVVLIIYFSSKRYLVRSSR